MTRDELIEKQLNAWCADASVGEQGAVYVEFATAGIVMPDWLRANHPERMLIVLEHRAFDVKATGDRFKVLLTFNRVPVELVIPYQNVARVYDRNGGPYKQRSKPKPPPPPKTAEVVSLDAYRKSINM